MRALLRSHPDGLTVREVGAALGMEHGAAYKALAVMPDAYIDRYTRPVKGPYAGVWCVVTPPPNCPRPDGQNTDR